MWFSEGGVADTLEGMTITKTAAKEWNVDRDDVKDLPPADPGKKRPKYHLADVIGIAYGKLSYASYRYGRHCGPRVKNFSEKRHLYARFLIDKCREECEEEEDPAIVRAAYDSARGAITRLVKDKEDKIEKLLAELAAEKVRLDAFDAMVKDMNPNDGDDSMSATAMNKGDALGAKILDGEEENIENNSKRPVAKKQRIAAKGLSVATDK